MAEDRWRRSWVEYVDFLFANKQRPRQMTDDALNHWYMDNYGQMVLDKLPDREDALFSKITDESKIYQAAVVDPYHDRSVILLNRQDIEKMSERDDDKAWWGAYNEYIDFCQNNNRLPGRAYTIDRKILKWYTENKEAWLSGNIQELKDEAFADLIAWSIAFN